MCIGYNPVAQAMPYMISSLVSLTILVLLYTLPIVKKWNPKSVKVAKIVMAIISAILLIITYTQYFVKAEAVKC